MLHGKHFFFSFSPRWERDFSFFQHLCSENAIFFIFSTPLQREAQKLRNPHLEAIAWACRCGRRKFENHTKSSPTPLDFDRNVFFETLKMQQIASRLCVILKEYSKSEFQRKCAQYINFMKMYHLSHKT